MSRLLTDHETIRRWADACGVQPRRRVSDGGDDPGLQFSPATDELAAVELVSWAAWFHLFDAHNLALEIDDAARQPSPANQVVKRPRPTLTPAAV